MNWPMSRDMETSWREWSDEQQVWEEIGELEEADAEESPRGMLGGPLWLGKQRIGFGDRAKQKSDPPLGHQIPLA